LRAWTGDATPIRTLDVDHVVALAADGSVAVTWAGDSKPGDRLDVWALPSLTHLHSRSFEHGVKAVLAVSARAALLQVNTGIRGDPYSEPSVPPPRWYGKLWTFATNNEEMQQGFRRCHESAAFSADARRVICRGQFSEVTWIDLQTGGYKSPQLAADWTPPQDEDEEEEEIAPPVRREIIPHHPYFILSLRLGANGDDVYVTYSRTARGDEHATGWRLDRWTPGMNGTSDLVVRLAATDADVSSQLLAASRDGSLLILADPLAIRRAPRFEAQELPVRGASAAAVSPDGKRIVSGHFDGTLRIWDAGTGRLLATAGP
jgi:hypothetical protein